MRFGVSRLSGKNPPYRRMVSSIIAWRRRSAAANIGPYGGGCSEEYRRPAVTCRAPIAGRGGTGGAEALSGAPWGASGARGGAAAPPSGGRRGAARFVRAATMAAAASQSPVGPRMRTPRASARITNPRARYFRTAIFKCHHLATYLESFYTGHLFYAAYVSSLTIHVFDTKAPLCCYCK